MGTHNLCFVQKFEKYQSFYLKIFSFLEVNVSVYLNRRVFVILADQRLKIPNPTVCLEKKIKVVFKREK